MQYLWTPWRMEYISGAGDEAASEEVLAVEHIEEAARGVDLTTLESTNCVFCDRVRLPQSEDRASLILLRAEHNFVILNLYPYNSAHLMVVPYMHTADLPGLPPETLNEMMSLVQKMVGTIGVEYHPEAFNLGMNLGRVAGAGVADHLHMHVVPRWAGDTNFMPVVGATKVLPELLERTYDRFKIRPIRWRRERMNIEARAQRHSHLARKGLILLLLVGGLPTLTLAKPAEQASKPKVSPPVMVAGGEGNQDLPTLAGNILVYTECLTPGGLCSLRVMDMQTRQSYAVSSSVPQFAYRSDRRTDGATVVWADGRKMSDPDSFSVTENVDVYGQVSPTTPNSPFRPPPTPKERQLSQAT